MEAVSYFVLVLYSEFITNMQVHSVGLTKVDRPPVLFVLPGDI